MVKAGFDSRLLFNEVSSVTKIKVMNNLLSFGNTKLPSSTAIFNMSSATDCPSAKLGLCKISHLCYAKKPEKGWAPNCVAFRSRQTEFWLGNNRFDFASKISAALAPKKNINALRFNEAGDFHSQECVEKAVFAARVLDCQGIKTYVYTKRDDLNFRKRGDLQVIGSNKMYDIWYVSVKNAKQTFEKSKAKKKFLCPGSCKSCSMCITGKGVKVFAELH